MKKFIYSLAALCLVVFGTQSCKEKTNSPVKEDTETPTKKKKDVNDIKENTTRQSNAFSTNTDYEEGVSLADVIVGFNSLCPEDIGDGMYMNSMYMDGVYCVMEVVVDEDYYDLGSFDFSGLSKYDRLSLLDTFADDDFKEFLALIVSENRGFAFRYVGDMSRDYVDVKFSVADLKTYLS